MQIYLNILFNSIKVKITIEDTGKELRKFAPE
jgi:hypothetical protein